jgi:hypothetical protein
LLFHNFPFAYTVLPNITGLGHFDFQAAVFGAVFFGLIPSLLIGLAQWVIDMDDGRLTVFRWLSSANTGYASQSRDGGYHGPGRGSGNSLNALIDGHRMSDHPSFLSKAEQLVRRCIHPDDDIARRNLLDVENRWFYTIFLQALGKYLDGIPEVVTVTGTSTKSGSPSHSDRSAYTRRAASATR